MIRRCSQKMRLSHWSSPAAFVAFDPEARRSLPDQISITLRDCLYRALLRQSEEEGRSPSDLIAFLLEEAIADGWRPSDRSSLPVSDGAD